MSKFQNSILLITGGTGSFGYVVLKHFLTTDIKEIRIFSRDEKKQDDMRHDLQIHYPDHASKVKFYIGVKGSSMEDSLEKSKVLGKSVLDMVQKLI